MTTYNPFRDRIQVAAEQGYTDSPRRQYVRTVSAPIRNMGYTEITPKQTAYAADLLARRDLTAEVRPKFRARLEVLAADTAEISRLNRTEATALIDVLQALPFKTPVDVKPASVAGDIPAGRYALDNANGGTSFYRVDRPTEGRWVGCIFVKLMVSDDTIRIGPQQAAEIIRRIEQAGVREAAIRYGHEIGDCAICGRTLTNEASRLAGIGPVCAAKSGW